MTHPTRSALGLLSVVASIIASISLASDGGDDPMYDATAVAEVEIRAPIGLLMQRNRSAEPVAGTIAFDGGPPVSMMVEPYGVSRLQICELPLLLFDLDDEQARDTAFAGHDTLRLVTPCQLGGRYDRYTVLEYLVYATYRLVSEVALGVRLVEAQFRDTGVKGTHGTGHAFFVQDINDFAADLECRWLPEPPKRLDDVDPAALTVMTLFQYMVSNSDWSAIRGPSFLPCCHNVALLDCESSEQHIVLPFDFDYSGVVNAPYALPPENLGTTTVRQRVYRGFCRHNSHLSDAIEVFNSRRAEIEALFRRSDLPYPNDRARALAFVEQFYDTINTPKKLHKRILRRCR